MTGGTVRGAIHTMGFGSLTLGSVEGFTSLAQLGPSRGTKHLGAPSSETRGSATGTLELSRQVGLEISSSTYTELRRRAQANSEQVDLSFSSQLEFDFFFQSQSTQLATFSQRTNAVADGLSQVARQGFLETSQAVAARFQFSASVSGVVLNGFAGSAETLATLGDEAANALSEFTKAMLERVNEALNDVFGMLEGFGSGLQRHDGARELLDLMDSFNPFGDLGGQRSVTVGELAVQLEFSFSFSFTLDIQVTQGEVQQADPIVLDLDGDGIELTSHRDGARFDLLGDGHAVNTAFVTGGDAFLAFDRNGNGRIDSGLELFGDQHGAANGLEELAKFDTNGDGIISALDADFSKLLLFKDNGNGITEEGELITLAEAGIESIRLASREVDRLVSGGNRIRQITSFTRTDGTRGTAVDVLLNFTV